MTTMRFRTIKIKPLIVDPDAEVFATDDGEQLDNSEVGGLTGSTFVIGGDSAKKRKTASRSKLGSGAASAETILAQASGAGDELLPLLPLSPTRSTTGGEETEEEDNDDLLALVAADAEGNDGEADTLDPMPVFSPPKERKAREKAERPQDLSVSAEMSYRFPHSKTALEILPDLPGTFCVRMAYHRGKTAIPVFQTTPLRSVAEIRCRGQHFPVFLRQHARKKRDRVLLGAKRRTTLSWRAAVRCGVMVTGRDDRFTWFWRVTATAPALAMAVSTEAKDRAPEAIRLQLPFAPGRAKLLTLPGAEGHGIVLLNNDVAVSIFAQKQNGVLPLLTADENGVYLSLENADLAGVGSTISWETWFTYAKTEVEAVSALAVHLADAADRAQIPPTATPPFLRRVTESAERELSRQDIIEKRGADKNAFRIGPHRADVLLVGPGADAALTTLAILNRYLSCGDEMLKRRARLLANGICEFQNNIEESPHWGAFFDALVRKTEWGDLNGKRTVSFTTTARIAKGMQVLQSHFEVELYERTALAAAQWLLLRLDRDGLPQAERFTWDGKPLMEASPWLAGEALLPLVEAFRTTKNEVYFKTSLRIVTTLAERHASFTLTFDTASTANLAALAEGVLLVSQEYERPDLIAFARQIGEAMRARRLPDGTISNPGNNSAPAQEDLPLLASTLAGARAALALSRVDDPVLWTVFALRGIRAADGMLNGYGGYVNVADRGALMSLSMNVLLGIATRAEGGVADWDKMTLKRGWQTFMPDPATAEYVKVSLPNGDSPDYLALVCPVTQQVLIAIYAPVGTETVEIIKNNKRPIVKNLLTGELSATATLQPLETTGTEGNIGVFLADT
ncbi:MAG: hypothetical protein H7145_16625 [Akkermansiaceae bacterium]|nr:hypothetical protein [Armatimonadota bacterium]